MPQLKIYEAKQSCDSYLPRDTRELLGARLGQSQGTWYIVAHTAAEAVEIADHAGIPHVSSPRSLRVWGGSVHAEALKVVGYLRTHGEVVAHMDKGGTNPVARFTGNGWLIIGQFEYDARARREVFIPEES
jgi:hypothetical protein